MLTVQVYNFTIRHQKSERSMRANIACMTVSRVAKIEQIAG